MGGRRIVFQRRLIRTTSKANVKANVIDQVLRRQDHDHKAKTVKMERGPAKGNVPKGTSPSGKPNQPLCFRYLKGRYTKPSCDVWPPPVCVKHKADEGCKFGKSQSFLHSDDETSSKKSKKDQKSETTTVAIVRSNQKLGCESQGRRVARRNGWTYGREKAHLEEVWQGISKSTS